MAKSPSTPWPVLDAIAPLLWPIVAVAAVARLVVRFAATFGGAALPERFRELGVWAREREAFTNSFLLCAAVLAVVLSLPARVRRSAGSTRTNVLFVTGGLLLLGLAAVRTVFAHPLVVIAQMTALILLFLFVAVLALGSTAITRGRIAVAAALTALTLPCLWRALFEISGAAGEPRTAILARKAADVLVPLSIAGLVVLGDFSPAARRRTALAVILPVFFLAASILHPLAVREALADVTQLWFTTLPWAVTAILAAAALFSVMKLVTDATAGAANAGLALAALIWLGASVLPVRPEGILLSYLALGLVLAAVEGRAKKVGDLADSFRA